MEAQYDVLRKNGHSPSEAFNETVEELTQSLIRLVDENGMDWMFANCANIRDQRFYELARKEKFKNARITAFGSTRKPNTRAGDDPNLRALIDSQAPCVAIVGKSSPLHVEEVMGNTRAENLAMIRDSTGLLREHGREVIYDAEHFFDGWKEDPDYAFATLAAAAAGGADILVLCDTNGGSLPFDVHSAVADVLRFLSAQGHRARIGIHTHNDCGLAVANSIAAVQAGAIMVQGTVNGYGERCGNADLMSVIPVLSLKMGHPTISESHITQLKSVSRFVSETANMIPLNSRPFVGKSAFAHKGGLHVNAIVKLPRAYEHMDPALVGNQRRVLVSDMSGQSNVAYKAKELGVEIGGNGVGCKQIVTEIKTLEDKGYQFDVADGSLKILLQKCTEQFKPRFELESFRVTIEKDKDKHCAAHATIKITVDGKHEITAAEGSGPVSALDNALRKALDKFFPDLESMRLVDFKVRVIDGCEGTAARVRVFIESRDQEDLWTTLGVSEDIIEASWHALADSFQYKLAKQG
jgi:2-isopropylmalate synthase